MRKPTWWTKNISRVAAWGIPAGKKFGDFFDKNVEGLRKNLEGWPKYKHHKPKLGIRNLCLRYQTEATCCGGCPMAHIPSDKLRQEDRKEMDKRLRQILS